MLELRNILEVSALRSSLIPAIFSELFGDLRKFSRSEPVYCGERLPYLLRFDMYIAIYHFTIYLCIICVFDWALLNILEPCASPPPSHQSSIGLDVHSLRIAFLKPYSVPEAWISTRHWWPRRDTSQVPMQSLGHWLCEPVSHNHWRVLLNVACFMVTLGIAMELSTAVVRASSSQNPWTKWVTACIPFICGLLVLPGLQRWHFSCTDKRR